MKRAFRKSLASQKAKHPELFTPQAMQDTRNSMRSYNYTKRGKAYGHVTGFLGGLAGAGAAITQVPRLAKFANANPKLGFAGVAAGVVGSSLAGGYLGKKIGAKLAARKNNKEMAR